MTKSLKWTLLLCSLTLSIPAGSQDQHACPWLAPSCKLNDAISMVLARERQGTWKTIQWRKSTQEALAEAQKTEKPILVFFVVNDAKNKSSAAEKT